MAALMSLSWTYPGRLSTLQCVVALISSAGPSTLTLAGLTTLSISAATVASTRAE